MKDIAHLTFKNDSTLLNSDECDDNTISLSFLNTPQSQYLQQQQYRVNRESLLLDDGDDHPLCNERPSKKNLPWFRLAQQYATDMSLLSSSKVHQPESADSSDFGLGPRMARNTSQGTPPPPPPTNRSKPGAIHVPGFQAETNTHLGTESTLQSAPTKSSAPILQASVVNDEQEQPSSPNAALPVRAEPMKDGESKSRSCCAIILKDRRLLAILITLIVTIVSFAIGISLVIMNHNKETTNTTTVEYVPATPAPTATTLPPSSAPTEAMEFLAPSN